MCGLLEGGAYFNVDTQRCNAYKRAALIRGNMILPGLHFFDTAVLFIPYPP